MLDYSAFGKKLKLDISAFGKKQGLDTSAFKLDLGTNTTSKTSTPAMVTGEPIKEIMSTGTKAIGEYLLNVHAPVVKPTIEKIKAGVGPIEAYKTSYEEIKTIDKKTEEAVRLEVEEAQKQGASDWEISKIASQSPQVQSMAWLAVGFMGGMKIRVNQKLVFPSTKMAIKRAIPKLKPLAKTNPTAKNLLKILQDTQKSGWIDINLERWILGTIEKNLAKYGIKGIPTTVAEKGFESVGKAVQAINSSTKITPVIAKNLAKESGNISIMAKVLSGELAKQATLPDMPEVTAGVPVGKPKDVSLKGAKKLKLELEEPATTAQIKQAHIIAREKALITKEGRTTPQYRKLAEGLTRKRSITEMTKDEADTFINGLQKIESRFVRGEQLPPIIPETKSLTVEGFFEREFGRPTPLKYITPSDRYARSLGVYDLIEPSIKANTKMLLERREIFKWIEDQEKLIAKLEEQKLPETIKAGIKNVPTKAQVKWFNLLDKNTTALEAGLTGESAKVFTELRNLTNRILERTNVVRKQVGLEPITGLKSYITHIKDIATKGILKEKFPFPEEISYWLDSILPKHIYNPTAFHRISQDKGLLENPFTALKAMVSMDLKQIYLEKPNILFREQMKAFKDIIPASTRKWVEAYVNEVIKGYPTKLDGMTNEALNSLGVTKMIDTMLKPFGRELGINPAKQMSGALSRVIHDAVIWGRIKLVIRNHTQKFLTLGLYGPKAFTKSLFPASKELNALVKSNDFWKISMGEYMERIPADALGKLERIGFIPYGKSHISNVGFSMKAAYYGAKDLVNNPKYAKYGWTNEDVIKEIEFSGHTTQYWYNIMGMPEVYRSGLFRTFGVLQTWWMNYTMNYWREILHRTFTGKTGWGKPIPPSWRVGSLRHIITSLLFVEGTRKAFGWDYSRVALFGVLPTFLSPPAQIIVGLYNYITADTEYNKSKAENQIKYSLTAFIPGSMAWKEWFKAWESGNLEELLFYTEKEETKSGGLKAPGGTLKAPGGGLKAPKPKLIAP